MGLAAYKDRRQMFPTKFSLSFGISASRSIKQNSRVANDNLSREQELFERCVQRELGALSKNSGEQENNDQDQPNSWPN